MGRVFVSEVDMVTGNMTDGVFDQVILDDKGN